MTEINDTQLLDEYLKKYSFHDICSAEGLPFRLFRYEVGEILNMTHPQQEYFKFLVEGRIAVDAVDSDGTTFRLFEVSPFSFLGGADLCNYRVSTQYFEVIEPVYCIELPVKPYRDILWNDLKFMQFMVSGMSKTIYLGTTILTGFGYDIEGRLLTYIKNYCKNNTFSGMELTAKRLRCSRRQLQRVVSQLTEAGKLEKTGWGTYKLR